MPISPFGTKPIPPLLLLWGPLAPDANGFEFAIAMADDGSSPLSIRETPPDRLRRMHSATNFSWHGVHRRNMTNSMMKMDKTAKNTTSSPLKYT